MRGFAISEKNENKYVNIHLVTRTRLSDCKTQMYSICPNPVWDYQMYLFVHSVRHTKAKLHPVCFIPTCSSVSFTIFHFYFDTYVLKRKKNHSPRDWLRFFSSIYLFGRSSIHFWFDAFTYYGSSTMVQCLSCYILHSHATSLACQLPHCWSLARNNSPKFILSVILIKKHNTKLISSCTFWW